MPQINVHHGKKIPMNPEIKYSIVEAIERSLKAFPAIDICRKGFDPDFFLREFAGHERKLTIFIIGLFRNPSRTNEIVKGWTEAMFSEIAKVLREHFKFAITLEIVPIMVENPEICTFGPIH